MDRRLVTGVISAATFEHQERWPAVQGRGGLGLMMWVAEGCDAVSTAVARPQQPYHDSMFLPVQDVKRINDLSRLTVDG